MRGCSDCYECQKASGYNGERFARSMIGRMVILLLGWSECFDWQGA